MFPKVVYTDDVTVINAQNLNDIQDAIIQHDADIDSKSDQDGYYEDMTVGMAEELVGTTFTEDDTPYQVRKSGGEVEVGTREYLNKLVGGSLGWNQLCNGSSVTVPSGHKYYMKKSGTASIGASTGSAITGLTSGTDMVIDLTTMFGSTIADYVYGLEQTTAGAGVAWLSKYIDLSTYHAYDNGSIQSVQATAHVTTGKNYFNPTVGKYVNNDGTITSSSGSNWCVDKFFSIGNTTKITGKIYDSSSGYTGSCGCAFFDDTMTFISATNFFTASAITSYPYTNTLTVPSGAKYFGIRGYQAGGASNILNTPIQIELGSTATDYEPYIEHTYPLGSDILRGYPMLVNNELAYDGDVKTPDGTITRKYGYVDLGSLTWTYNSASGHERFVASVTPQPRFIANNVAFNGVCAKYEAVSNGSVYDHAKDKIIGVNDAHQLAVYDSAYTTAAAFKTAMSGVYLVYELATLTTESGTAFQKIQTIDKGGIEQFVCTTPVPVGHYTQYPKDLWSTLDKLADIFTPPTANGTYTLKVTVNNGVATYSWVAG